MDLLHMYLGLMGLIGLVVRTWSIHGHLLLLLEMLEKNIFYLLNLLRNNDS